MLSPWLIDIPSSATVEDFESYLVGIPPDKFSTISEIVLRVPHESYLQLTQDQSIGVREGLISRVAIKPIQILSYHKGKYHIYQVRRIYAAGHQDSNAVAIAQIRDFELRQVFNSHSDSCLYPVNAGFHYIAPSLMHCNVFIRIADLVRNRAALDTLAFWMQDIIYESGAILIDSWGISSVIMRSMQMQGLDTPFDCLSAYPRGEDKETLAIIQRLLSQLPPDKESAFIVSFNSSGNLVSRVQDYFSRNNASLKCYSLFGTRNLPMSGCLSRLGIDVINYEADDCQLCADNSKPLLLNSKLYYLKEAGEFPVVLQKRHFMQGESGIKTSYNHNAFIHRYSKHTSSFRFHRTDDDGRHHAFHIELGDILNDEVFRVKFSALLDTLNPAKFILTSLERDCRKLGAIASQLLGLPHVALETMTNLDSLTEGERLHFDNPLDVIVIEDLLIGGTKVDDYMCEFRASSATISQIQFVIGVSRTESIGAWESIRSSLAGHNWPCTIAAVERFYLPNLDQESCPWCAEARLLSRITANLPEPPEWLADRLVILNSTQRGIDEGIFHLPGVEVPLLASGSYTGPRGSDSKIILFSVANAVQSLRNDQDPAKRLQQAFPIYNIFALRNISRNFTEAIIRAALFRIILPSEWGMSLQSRDLSRFIGNIGKKPINRPLLGELLLGMFRGSIGTGAIRSLEKTFENIMGDDWSLFKKER